VTLLGVPVALWANEVLPYLSIYDFVSLRTVNKHWNKGSLALIQIHLNTVLQSKQTLTESIQPLRSTVEQLRMEAQTSLSCLQDEDFSVLASFPRCNSVLWDALGVIMSCIPKRTSNLPIEFRRVNRYRTVRQLLELEDSKCMRLRQLEAVRGYLSHYALEEVQRGSAFLAVVYKYWEIMLKACDIETKELLVTEKSVENLQKEQKFLTNILNSAQVPTSTATNSISYSQIRQ